MGCICRCRHFPLQHPYPSACQRYYQPLQQACALSSFFGSLPASTSFQIHTVFQDRLTSALTLVEKHLATRTFLATERISLADITLAAELQSAFSTTVDASFRAKLPNVLRHYETIVNQPNLASIFGSTAYAEKALQYTPPPKKKEKAPAAPAQPKAEKKAKKEEADDDDDDDDDKPYEEAPKEKNPLDLLPKSPFNLEDWKRAYSNKETRGSGGALEWFYQKFVLLIVSILSC